jgi:hypothetical protein
MTGSIPQFSAKSLKAIADGLVEHSCGKRRYMNKRDAITSRNHQLRKRGRHSRPMDLRAYPCPSCKGWHLTKRA